MDQKLKIGIIGVGGISNCHIQGYKAIPEVELYAFCDINETILHQKGERFGITRLYTDVNDMMAALPELDAVSVCTWNNGHAACAIAALNAGKHVLCEKPMAMNTAEALAMKEAADRSGKLLQVGFVRRYGEDCMALKDFIDNGDFGDIYYAKASYLRRNGNPGGWFGNKARSGGGPLIDLGVHVIDLVRYLMGNPKPVSVYGVTFNKLGDRPNIKKNPGAYVSESKTAGDICNVEDMAAVMIRFDNGAVLSIDASFSLNIKHDVGKIELFGTRSGAVLDPDLEMFTENNGYLTNVSLDAPTRMNFDAMFNREIRHFVDCIQTGCSCRAPAEDGIALMRILDAAYESARTGHEVVLA